MEDPARDEEQPRWPKELTVNPMEPTEEQSLDEFLKSANLTTDERGIYLHVDVNGKSCREAKAILGWSEIKVRVTLHRAREKVKKEARRQLRETFE